MELIPLWLKLAYTVFAAVTVAVYLKKYPLWNFLWFSDIALIATVPALWLENSLLASMMLVGVLLPELRKLTRITGTGSTSAPASRRSCPRLKRRSCRRW